MKVYRELEIDVPLSRREDFLTELESRLPKGWSRDRESEDRALKITDHAYFVCEAMESRHAALVALYEREPDLLYVSNVVPRDVNSLSHDEYNEILEAFAKTCVAPVVDLMGFRLKLSSGQQSFDDLVSPKSAKLFRTFSALANKSTGTSHPCDKERWYDFVISVVENGDQLDSDILTRWLIEEDGWAEDIAHRIASEFEMEVGLLKRYKGM